MMKILYVEDEIAHVELTQRALEDNLQEDFVLYHAESLQEALKILETESDIDLVLTDLRLPDGSGLDLLKRVKEFTSPPAVVLVTGQGDEQIAVTALKSGAADYLVKEGNYLNRLPPAINNAIAQNRLIHEQAALREAEHRFRVVVEQLPAAVYTDNHDQYSSAQYISPQIKDITGFSAEEWLVDPFFWLTRLHPNDHEAVLDKIKSTHESLNDFFMEYRIIHRDGRVVSIRDVAKIVFDAKGTPQYWQGILFDITKEVEAQATLGASEKRFMRIFHSTPIATCVVTVDTGRFIDANQAFQNLVGVPLEGLIGHTSIELGLWDANQNRDEFVAVLKEKGMVRDKEVRYPNVPNGPRDTLGFYEPIELGGETCLLAMFYDVTEQKKAQQALQAERDFALQVLNNMGQGLTVVNQESQIEYTNPAFAHMLGYKIDDLLGKKPADFTASSGQAVLQSEREKRHHGLSSTYEINLIHKNDHEVPVLITGVPRYQNGKINGAISVHTDLTVQKQNEKDLEKQVKELTALHAVATAEAESLSEDEIIQKVTKSISLLYSEVCGIILLDSTAQLLVPHPSYIGANISGWRNGYSVREGITGKCVSIGKIIRTGNITTESGYIEIEAGVRSELCVPIRAHERIIGVINVESKSTDMFTEHDEGFLVTVASGLGTALEKLRLFDEEQKRANEFAALYATTSKLTAKWDLEGLLETVLAQAMELLNATGGGIYLYNETRRDLEVAVARGVIMQPGIHLQLGEGMAGRVALSHSALIVDDYELWEHRSSQYRDMSIRAVIEVPMQYGGKLIGVLAVLEVNKSTRKFTEADAELLSLFAAQAAAAIDNARLYDETQRRLRELEILNRVSTSLRLAQAVDEMLPILLNEALLLLKTANGSIWLFDSPSNTLTQRIASGSEALLTNKVLKPGEGIAGYVFITGEKYISSELKVDPLLSIGNKESMTSGLTGICIPIQSTLGSVGVLVTAIEMNRELTDEINLLMILAEITGNAIHRAELFGQSQEQIHKLTTLRDIDAAIASSTDLRVTLNILMDHTLKHLKVDAVDIMLYHPELQSLTYLCSAGFNNPAPSRPLMRLGEGLAGQVVMKGGSEHVTDLRTSNEVKRDPMLIREGFITYFGIPLIIKGQIKGVFEIFHRSLFTPPVEWMQFLQTLAGQAAIAIDNAQLFDHLQKSNQEVTQAYDTTLEGWARALELRDRETEGHTRRVTELTMKLARFMEISDDELINIYRGVLLHDIGKMGVPDQILRKTGPLNDSEWIEMRKHPEYAFNLLAPIPFLRPALDIPYCHHEHWDGTGYPRGLKGEQIPLAARIFSIVDIWDALLSDRSYRKAWPEPKVIDYLKEISEKILDPKIVAIFLQMIATEK